MWWLYNLSRLGEEELNALQAAWPALEIQRRRDVMRELVEIGEVNFEVDFTPVFLMGLGDEDGQVRAAALSGLWEYEEPMFIGPLVHMLRADEATAVRAAAAMALGRYIYLREVEELAHEQGLLAEEALLETIYQAREEVEVRRRAVEAIAWSSETDVGPIIENAYYDNDEKMQVSAIFAMGRSADSRWQPQVLAELDNPSTEIRFEAVRACGELEAKEAVPRLVQLVEEEADRLVQQMALWSLGQIGGPVARDVLDAYCNSEDEGLALAAEDALDMLTLFDGSFGLLDFSEDNFDSALDDEDEWPSLLDYMN